MSSKNVWDRLYVKKTRNFRPRSPYVIRHDRTRGLPLKNPDTLYRTGMNTVCPLQGASVRPNTGYIRRMEKLIKNADQQVHQSSSPTTIVLKPQRPNTAPRIVSHVSCEQGSVNQKISDEKGSFGTTRNIFGGLFA
jgi:hypothetical protein